MKLLTELITDYRRLGAEDDAVPDTEVEFDVADQEDPEGVPNPNGEQDAEFDPELDGIVDQATEDPNRAGLIRTVKGAHLIYKRKIEDGTYEELWIYNVRTMRDEMEIRKAIIAGTDIPVNKTRSPDGSQTYTIWSAGNAELLNIEGLQN